MVVLLLAPEDDTHAVVVGERLRDRGAEFVILNTTWFPWKDRITWRPEGTVWHSTQTIDFARVRMVWWRRFRGPTLDPGLTDENVKAFCGGEASELMHSIFLAGVPIMNQPMFERWAAHKPYQLRLAEQLGLTVPRTIISNDRQDILAFMGQFDRTILKTLVCDYPHNVPTRVARPEDFAEARNAALAPTIVQECIDCAKDIRVCIVGDTVFAGELEREDAASEVDWRMTASGWEPHRLPEALAARLLSLVRAFRLDFASADLRLTPDGDYVFFEINPNGQFLFLEIDAGLPISQAFADHLIAGSSVAFERPPLMAAAD
jgi:glutathione synthase/RimK-type ligase-like ATP-grasp enzyme